MESSLIIPTTADLTMSSELSFEIYEQAKLSGLVIRYDTIEYRGETANFVSDPMGVWCCAQWKGRLIDLGLNNIYYKEDVCRIIDRELDLITEFRNCPNFAGAKLEYFRNGDYRDIRLVYKGRTLKVYPVIGDVDNINETFLISESERILRTSGLLTD